MGDTNENTTNVVTYDAVCGVTYYQLISKFSGDTTKNCGLYGYEVDGNFYFLRGYDIKNIDVENGYIIVDRLDDDYNTPHAMSAKIPYPTFEYSREDGTLTVTYPDQETPPEIIDGFLTPSQISGNTSGSPSSGSYFTLFTDETLIGDSTEESPIGINRFYYTGVYYPASEYIDLTTDPYVYELSACTHGKNYTVVTKEVVDDNEYKYYINIWDGEDWYEEPHELLDGESIVILGEKDGKTCHAWRMNNGELVDIDCDFDKIEMLSSAVTNINSEISIIQSDISGITENITEIEDNLQELSSSTIDNLSLIMSASVSYTNEEINSLQIPIDVIYEYPIPKLNQAFIRLLFNDGSKSIGFDATEFTANTHVSSVDLIQDSLVVRLNDNVTTFTTPLSALSNTYTVEDSSKKFLSINNREIGVNVDNNGEYNNSLATTNYVNTQFTNSVNSANSFTQINIAELSSNTMTSISNTKASLNNVIAETSGSVINQMNTNDDNLRRLISANTLSIDILNSDYNTLGSVRNVCVDEIEEAMISREVVLRVLDNAQLVQVLEPNTLMREIAGFDNKIYYYVSNRAEDMSIREQSGSSIMVNLQDYILQLNERIEELEEFKRNFPSLVKEIIRDYIQGTRYEIKTTPNGDESFVIGLDDEAVLGDTDGLPFLN